MLCKVVPHGNIISSVLGYAIYKAIINGLRVSYSFSFILQPLNNY